MFMKEIEAIFTQKAAEYIQNGYIFSINTMSGSQGEVAKVDFIKGNEIIRVKIEREADYMHGIDMLIVFVGRNTNKDIQRLRNRYNATIWNHDLEEIEKSKFYKLGESKEGVVYYTDSETVAHDAFERRMNRWKNKTSSRQCLNEAAKSIVLPFVRRQNGCKSYKVSDIERVEKVYSKHGASYIVTAKGKQLTMNRGRA